MRIFRINDAELTRLESHESGRLVVRQSAIAFLLIFLSDVLQVFDSLPTDGFLTGEEDMYTLQLMLKNIADQAVGQNEYKMAAASIGMFPLIVVYIFIQDYIIKSTSIGSGLKG